MPTQSPTRPPALTRRSPWYLLPDAAALPALLAHFRAHPELVEWRPRAGDTRRPRELARFYHRPPGALGRVEPAGIVVDKPTGAGCWIRLDGSDAGRARPILEALAVEPEPAPPAVEQLGLFAQAVGGGRW